MSRERAQLSSCLNSLARLVGDINSAALWSTRGSKVHQLPLIPNEEFYHWCWQSFAGITYESDAHDATKIALTHSSDLSFFQPKEMHSIRCGMKFARFEIRVQILFPEKRCFARKWICCSSHHQMLSKRCLTTYNICAILTEQLWWLWMLQPRIIGRWEMDSLTISPKFSTGICPRKLSHLHRCTEPKSSPNKVGTQRNLAVRN